MLRESGKFGVGKSILVYASYWYMIGPACGVALQLYINYRYGLLEAIGRVTVPDAICVASCAVLAGYILASLWVPFGRWRKGAVASSALFALASIFAWGGGHAGFLAGDAGPWVVVASVCFSCFFMTQLLVWFEVFVCHEAMLNLVYILLSSVLAIMLWWFLMGLTGPRLVAFIVVMIVAATSALAKAVADTPELGARSVEERDHSRSSLVWGAGMLGITFFFGVGFMYTTSFLSIEAFHSRFDWSIPLYALVLCLVMVLLSHRVRISVLYYLAVPVIVTGMVLALTGAPAPLSPHVFNEIGFFTFLVFVLVLFCAFNHDRRYKVVRSASLLILGLYLGLFVGRQLFVAVDVLVVPDAREAVHVACVLAAIVLLVSFAMVGLHFVGKIISTDMAQPQLRHITTFDSAEFIKRIVAIYGLSDRERQVLALLYEGKATSEIAVELVIAPGTAKAHVNNIYKKLGIHTRKQLSLCCPTAWCRKIPSAIF